jgi:hypothetical protein
MNLSLVICHSIGKSALIFLWSYIVGLRAKFQQKFFLLSGQGRLGIAQHSKLSIKKILLKDNMKLFWDYQEKQIR